MSRVTQTLGADDRAVAAPALSAHLFLALQAHQPTVPGAAFRLDAGEVVVLGGGDANAERRRGGKLCIEVADPWSSTQHARLEPTLGRWRLVDDSSKNGSFVNGRRATSQVLDDGDVIEIGRSFFVFRAGIEPADDELPDADAFRTVLPPLRRALATLARVARSAVPILLEGETGTGKELLAGAIHHLSERRGPLVAFNCGALTEGLVQSELFGHREGAFSGASEDRPGLIRSADHGTLFLDEVAELRPAAQIAMLRALEHKEVIPVGGTRPHAVEFRLIAATNRDLRALADEQMFRLDLYNRLAGFRFQLPPLRERREDLSLLVGTMLRDLDAAACTFTPAAVRRLLAHDWSGNLRQLARCLETAVVVSTGQPIGPEHLTLAAAAGAPDLETDRAPAPLDAAEQEHRSELERLLRAHDGNVAAVGRAVGKAPGQIRRWLRRYGLDPDAHRK